MSSPLPVPSPAPSTVTGPPRSHPTDHRLPDPVSLLASLCDASTYLPIPLVAAAVASHPITWVPLDRRRLAPPRDAWAIGVIGGGTTHTGEDVVVAFVVDEHDRQRAVVWRDGSIIDTATPSGDLVNDCRSALGLRDRAE